MDQQENNQSTTVQDTVNQSTTTNNGTASTPPVPPTHDDRRMYPEFTVKRNEHPKILFAIPFVGLLIKLILIIPVYIVQLALGLVVGVLWAITPFVILFKGRHWDIAYEMMSGLITYQTKVTLYLTGVTDIYPGFNLKPNDAFTLHIRMPEKSSRMLGFPILGFLVRLFITLPYTIYASVLSNGMRLAAIASWFAVMYKKTYPESLHEFVRDTTRVHMASMMYLYYLSDVYPSFKISMNHKKVKIALIVLGALWFVFGDSGEYLDKMDKYKNTNESTIVTPTPLPLPNY